MWIGTGVYLDNIEAFRTGMATEIDTAVNANRVKICVLAGVIFIGIIVLTLLIALGITRSLKEMVVSFQDIAEGEGDLTKCIEIRSKDEIGELAICFNTFLEKLQGIIRKLADNAGLVNQSSNQLSDIASQLASGADDTSRRIENLSTAAEEMTATINEIAQNAEKARDISGRAVEQAHGASDQMTL